MPTHTAGSASLRSSAASTKRAWVRMRCDATGSTVPLC
jgi:hypothetical protein